eukprot:6190840-Pleurochrysis_carterae.AAC.4
MVGKRETAKKAASEPTCNSKESEAHAQPDRGQRTATGCLKATICSFSLLRWAGIMKHDAAVHASWTSYRVVWIQDADDRATITPGSRGGRAPWYGCEMVVFQCMRCEARG